MMVDDNLAEAQRLLFKALESYENTDLRVGFMLSSMLELISAVGRLAG